MSRRAKEWAVKARAELMDKHGNECAWCGENCGLQFDCIIPQGDAHHRFSTDKRMTFYRRQDAAGNLQVLCADCNTTKSVGERRRARLEEFSGTITYAARPSQAECPF